MIVGLGWSGVDRRGLDTGFWLFGWLFGRGLGLRVVLAFAMFLDFCFTILMFIACASFFCQSFGYLHSFDSLFPLLDSEYE